MCILDDLYYEWYLPREMPRAEGREEWARNEELWTQAEKSLDAELLEELRQNVSHLIDLESCHEFREGFRLGVKLMLEANLFLQ